ncbi:MAG: serine/threonine-protein kinase [Planctomycetota bacterium]
MPDIPGYTFNAKLAEGGCADIYAALEHSTGRLVAIKILSPRNANNKTEQKRLTNEGALWLRLGQHDNIVQTYCVGTVDKMPYVVLEYIDGTTLRQLLVKGKKFIDVEVLKLAKNLCQAMQFLHNHNVVHKDIKPDNIMITNKGAVKLLDFGFAEKIKTFNLFGGKSLEGSPNYMAPELFVTGKATVATDIYALGCTLYEITVGSPPFSGMSNNEIINLQTDVSVTISPICQVNKNISPVTEKIILTACQKNLTKRFKSVDEILLDLARNHGWRRIKSEKSQKIPVNFA